MLTLKLLKTICLRTIQGLVQHQGHSSHHRPQSRNPPAGIENNEIGTHLPYSGLLKYSRPYEC